MNVRIIGRPRNGCAVHRWEPVVSRGYGLWRLMRCVRCGVLALVETEA